MSEQQNIAIVIGATGLVGKQLIQMMLKQGHYQCIYQIVRQSKSVDSTDNTVLKTIVVPDFLQLEAAIATLDLNGADAFSTLGTTLKQAGSRQAFKQVDYQYNVNFAQIVQQRGARHFLLLSALGANPDAVVFYNQVKGQTERAISALKFEQFSVFQPSLLLGQHQDSRMMEGMAQQLFLWTKPMIPKTWNYRPIEAERVAASMLAVARRPLAEKMIYSNHDMLSLTLEKSE
jgi:uncharacterized protein YbjT (DUF2867 family)